MAIPSDDVRKLTRAVVLLSLACAVSLAAAVMGIRTGYVAPRSVVSVDSKGVVVPVVPLTEKVYPDSRVIGLVQDCVIRAFSHDGYHVDMTLPEAQQCFTPTASDRYAESMQPLVATMKEKSMVMVAVIKRPPRVERVYMRSSNDYGKAVAWDLNVAYEMFMEGRNQRVPSQLYKARITVIRVPFSADPRGLLIDGFTTSPANSL